MMHHTEDGEMVTIARFEKQFGTIMVKERAGYHGETAFALVERRRTVKHVLPGAV
jgi:hypothetical protein